MKEERKGKWEIEWVMWGQEDRVSDRKINMQIERGKQGERGRDWAREGNWERGEDWERGGDRDRETEW